MDQAKAILVTGGAGFIGSHVVRLLVNKYPHYRIINLDALTYAGNLANLKDVEGKPNYAFEKANICDEDSVNKIFSDYHIEAVIHLAAESHVDRSISNPTGFFMTNIIGTVNLLNAARIHWDENFPASVFTISQRMRSMDLWEAKACLQSIRHTIREVPILLQRQAQITLFVLISTLISFQLNYPIALTIMVRISFLKS